MSWTLLFAASAIITSLLVLTLLLRQISAEVARLRNAMRRAQVAAVVGDELRHQTINLAASASALVAREAHLPIKDDR